MAPSLSPSIGMGFMSDHDNTVYNSLTSMAITRYTIDSIDRVSAGALSCTSWNSHVVVSTLYISFISYVPFIPHISVPHHDVYL